jgi:hypothetical protein
VSAERKRRPFTWRERFRKLTNTTHYQGLRLLQSPLGWAFWTIEKAKSRLQDQRDNEGWEI